MNKTSIKKNFFEQLNSDLPNFSKISLPKKNSKKKIVLLSTLISSAVVVAASIAIIVPLVNKETTYKDNSNSLNTLTIGEASINNIGKYTAIGVGKLNKISPNKKYSLITNLENNEEESEEDYADLSNTLIGLTTDGVLEELSLTIQNGQQLNSSAFNITYYEEIGDFVLVSVLPMDVNEYVSGANGEGRYTYDQDGEKYTASSKECVSFAINHLVYPLKYSIRYYDSQNKEYEYIDTSYLIHKRSGKIFPFSSRKYCVDAKKCKNGQFKDPTIVVDNENITSYPVNNLIEFVDSEPLRIGYDWDIEQQRIVFWPWETHYLDYYDFDEYNCFHNGFYVFVPLVEKANINKPYDNYVRYENRYLFSIVFDEEISALEITSMKIRDQDGFGWESEGDNVISIYSNGGLFWNRICIDKFGNFICQFKDYRMYYNFYDKTFNRLNSTADIRFDIITKQYYLRVSEYTNDDEHIVGGDFVIFLNEKMEEDYLIDWDLFNHNCLIDHNGYWRNILEDQDWFLKNSLMINKNERLVFGRNSVVKVSLDENGHYYENTFTVVFDSPLQLFYCSLDACYYLDGLSVHIVAFSDNYDSCKDTILVTLDEYPFVEAVWYVGNGVLGFEGMDDQLNTIVGYIYPDGTISFEIEEFDVDTNTTILSPIN